MSRTVSKIMRHAGRINLIGLLLIALVAAGVWAIAIFWPVWSDNLDVKEAIHAAYYQSAHETDEGLRLMIKSRLNNNVGWHWEEDAEGTPQRLKGLGLEDEQIAIERDEAAKKILIRVDYARPVTLRPLAHVQRIYFHPYLAGPILP